MVVRPNSVCRCRQNVPAENVESEADNYVQAIAFDRRDICGVEAVDESLAHRHDVDRSRTSEEQPNVGRLEGCNEVRVPAFIPPDIQIPEKRAKVC